MKTTDILTTLSHYQPQTLGDMTSFSAAVLILLIYDATENISILLTKRSSKVTTYIGDYCFPGGMKEETDPDLKFTAERETQEELNLAPTDYQIIGVLDDFQDRFGNLVRPYVATITAQNFAEFHKIATDEIANLYQFPLHDLKKLAVDLKLERITRRHPTYSYTAGDVFIWGLTASMMVHLSNVLFDLNKPVAMKRLQE